MKGPLFSQDDLARIREMKLKDADVVHADFADWVLKVTRDRSDIGIPAGTYVVARKAASVADGELAVAVVDGEHVFRKAPVTDGQVVGLVLGVLVREADDDA